MADGFTPEGHVHGRGRLVGPSMSEHVDDGHAWQLRGVSYDLHVGAVEDYECSRCSAVTVRQAAAEGIGPA